MSVISKIASCMLVDKLFYLCDLIPKEFYIKTCLSYNLLHVFYWISKDVGIYFLARVIVVYIGSHFSWGQVSTKTPELIVVCSIYPFAAGLFLYLLLPPSEYTFGCIHSKQIVVISKCPSHLVDSILNESRLNFIIG